MKSLSMAVAGAAFMVLGTVAVDPVQAALIDFNFTTESGAAGTFTLNTDTLPSPEPALFGAGFTGISYPNAVSNLSFSSPLLNLNGEDADYQVAPALNSDILAPVFGFPFTGVLSGVSYPSGCAIGTSFTCRISVGVLYNGNLSELPVLSPDPNSYSSGSFVTLYDPITVEPLSTDRITNLQAVSQQRVPEPNSGLSVLAFSIGGAGLLLKRKMKTNKPLVPLRGIRNS